MGSSRSSRFGLLGEDDAELQASALASGERRDGAREVVVAEAELVREHPDFALELVAAREVVAVLDVGEVVERRARRRSRRRAGRRVSSSRSAITSRKPERNAPSTSPSGLSSCDWR